MSAFRRITSAVPPPNETASCRIQSRFRWQTRAGAAHSYIERALAFPLADGGGVAPPFIELEIDEGRNQLVAEPVMDDPALVEQADGVELVERQLPDGSWRNSYSFMKEDDPLIATTLAAAALANCRAAMWLQP